MKWKIIIGIVIPAMLVVFIAILGSLNIGFKVAENFSNELSLQELFKDNQLRQAIRIADITLVNEYFLSKRYNLPPRIACLIDNDKVKGPLDAGTLEYSEGDLSPNEDLNPFGSYNYGERSVQVKSGEAKVVSLFIRPSYVFGRGSYEELVENYADYDELIIAERVSKSRYDYYSCSSLNQAALDDAIHIRITA
jgi:hypothetical protein